MILASAGKAEAFFAENRIAAFFRMNFIKFVFVASESMVRKLFAVSLLHEASQFRVLFHRRFFNSISRGNDVIKLLLLELELQG